MIDNLAGDVRLRLRTDWRFLGALTKLPRVPPPPYSSHNPIPVQDFADAPSPTSPHKKLHHLTLFALE
jgi:hypothetical protein